MDEEDFKALLANFGNYISVTVSLLFFALLTFYLASWLISCPQRRPRPPPSGPVSSPQVLKQTLRLPKVGLTQSIFTTHTPLSSLVRQTESATCEIWPVHVNPLHHTQSHTISRDSSFVGPSNRNPRFPKLGFPVQTANSSRRFRRAESPPYILNSMSLPLDISLIGEHHAVNLTTGWLR